MNVYQVVAAAPAGNPHSAVFTELGIALAEAVRANGFECRFTQNELHGSAINIILGFHLLKPNDIPAGIRFIVYQLEQLSDTEGLFARFPEMLNLLRRAESVWDFSPENVLFLANKGISAQLIPAGYSPVLRTIPKENKEIDILFYGSRNDRRTAVLQELLDRGFRVKALFGLYGESRDQWIARSHLVINIHFYQASLFESVRMSYLVNNAVPVLSECSPSYPWAGVPLKMVPYEQLADRAAELLRDTNQLAIYGERCREALEMHCNTADLLKPFLSI